MNGDQALLDQFTQTITLASLNHSQLYLGLGVPSPYINDAVNKLNTKGIHIGAQTASTFSAGAFTGQVSAAMLKDVGADFTLVGHSERRLHETVANTQAQIEQCFLNHIQPILCVGESLEAYRNDKTTSVLKDQLAPLHVLNPPTNQKWIIAYEPTWAIGSGLTPSAEEIRMVVDWLKSQHECDVLYGGSVSANNLASILATGADGALVGGASLDVEQFNKMVDICIQSF